MNATGSTAEIWANCNGTVSDGCEVDILHDANNCGGCGTICKLPNVSEPGCGGGACSVIECTPGFLDCDKNPRNGCEVAADAGACPDAG
jgi:hypothetical protein